jgi:hypothetical protein
VPLLSTHTLTSHLQRSRQRSIQRSCRSVHIHPPARKDSVQTKFRQQTSPKTTTMRRTVTPTHDDDGNKSNISNNAHQPGHHRPPKELVVPCRLRRRQRRPHKDGGGGGGGIATTAGGDNGYDDGGCDDQNNAGGADRINDNPPTCDGPTNALVLLRSSSTIRMTVADLESGLTHRLMGVVMTDDDDDDDEGGGGGDHENENDGLAYVPRHDVHLLRCKQAPSHEMQTVLGIVEDRRYNNNNNSTNTNGSGGGRGDNIHPPDGGHHPAALNDLVEIATYEPVPSSRSVPGGVEVTTTLRSCCGGPHSEWIRSPSTGGGSATAPSALEEEEEEEPHQPQPRLPSPSPSPRDDDYSQEIKVASSSLWWVDLRSIQRHYDDDHDEQEEEDKERLPSIVLDTEPAVVRFLRSLLTASHEASPWGGTTNPRRGNNVCHLEDATGGGGDDDDTNGLEASATANDDDDDDENVRGGCGGGRPASLPDIVVVAMREVPTLLKEFRVGDVAPSWFLHAVAQMDDLESPMELFQPQQQQRQLGHQHANGCNHAFKPRYHHDDDVTSPATVLIYKKLAPRRYLSSSHPAGSECRVEGCLWEACAKGDDDVDDKADHDDDGVERNHHDGNNGNRQGGGAGHENGNTYSPSLYRQVCPPYLNLVAEYPNTTLAQLFSPEALRTFTEDALSIPQWVPWPETAHYKVRQAPRGDYGDRSGPRCRPLDRVSDLPLLPRGPTGKADVGGDHRVARAADAQAAGGPGGNEVP